MRMQLNIRIKFAPNKDTELIPVEAYTIFEVNDYKFFSHHPIGKNDKIVPDRWRCSEYFTGLAATWDTFFIENEAIENAKYIISKRPDLTNDISKAIEQYGYANKDD